MVTTKFFLESGEEWDVDLLVEPLKKRVLAFFRPHCVTRNHVIFGRTRVSDLGVTGGFPKVVFLYGDFFQDFEFEPSAK